MASLFIEPKSVATKPQYQYGEVGAGSRIRIKQQASLPFPCLPLNSAKEKKKNHISLQVWVLLKSQAHAFFSLFSFLPQLHIFLIKHMGIHCLSTGKHTLTFFLKKSSPCLNFMFSLLIKTRGIVKYLSNIKENKSKPHDRWKPYQSNSNHWRETTQ